MHAALFALKNGRTEWGRGTVVIVDEAAMLDARITGELLAVARQSRSKLILAGDDRQLASIERGGLFTELKARHGSAEITEVTRQRVDWQRQAAHDLAEGRFAEAVTAYDEAGAITWTPDQDEARYGAGRGLEARHHGGAIGKTLCVRLHQSRRRRAKRRIAPGPPRARRTVGAGDRVRDQTRARPLCGRRPGAVHRHRQKGRHLQRQCRHDHRDRRAQRRIARGARRAGPGKGREVAWSAAEFAGFRHGYAGTIYKGQGKTLDHTYLYHTHHWRAAASYVALTRQRDSAQVFVARETARDTSELARQMARGEVKAASIAWATREEMAERQVVLEPREGAGTWSTASEDSLGGMAHDAQRRAAASSRGVAAAGPADGKAGTATEVSAAAKEYWDNVAAAGRSAAPDPLTAKVRAASEARQQQTELPMPGWLIPPFVSRDGHDSLGRGLDPADIAAAVAADAGVQQAKSEPWRHLERAYRDPHTAQARLDELARAEGWTEAAARIDTTHEQLGPLRGRDGMFASPSAQLDRALCDHRGAERSATACAGSPRPSGGPSANTARVSRRNCSATPWGCRNSRPRPPRCSKRCMPRAPSRRATPGTPPRCAIGLPWHRLGKWDRGTPRSRRKSTGSRKPPSKDWARRGLSPFYAARMKTGPCCRGSNPGNGRR